jgi:asparagine synthase (glutamine-hydrolysing)
MGALVAILSKSGPADADTARRMLAAAPHRGTDICVQVCGNAVLAVSNTSESVNSVISAPGDVRASFSGTLDNADSLTCELTAAGFPPAAGGPADVVVSAFRAYGLAAPNRLRGVFSAVVTDGRQMWSFRDHLGFQPLFYSDNARGFFAATEAKQVIAGAGIGREPDTETLERIFYGRLSPRSPSAFKGVLRVPHATTLTVNGRGSPVPERYWHPGRLLESAHVSSFAEVQERFDTVFEQAVKRCLTGRDIVALSGGIDSPGVAGFAAPLYRDLTSRSLPALSLVFPNHPRVDESSYIQAVTDSLGMDLNTRVPRARVLDDLVHWCKLLDGPVPNISAPQLSEFYAEAKQLGCVNLLTGDIAECVFDLWLNLPGHLLVNGRIGALIKILSHNASMKIGSWRNLGGQTLRPLAPAWAAHQYANWRGHNVPSILPDWLRRETLADFSRESPRPLGWGPWAALQTAPLEGCPIAMEGVEICSAVSGVTVRRPFADVDVWEFFLSLPGEIKYPDLRSKTLVRRLLRGRVPDLILDRRDKTFFNDHAMSQIDYPLLRRFLVKPDYQVRGIDYTRLAERIEKEDFTLIDWRWAYDLIRVHAFLHQW